MTDYCFVCLFNFVSWRYRSRDHVVDDTVTSSRIGGSSSSYRIGGVFVSVSWCRRGYGEVDVIRRGSICQPTGSSSSMVFVRPADEAPFWGGGVGLGRPVTYWIRSAARCDLCWPRDTAV